MSTNAISPPGEPWDRMFAWVEAQLGATITGYERQARWRPAFFLDVRRGDETLALYYRGARPEIAAGVDALRHELRVLQQLEKEGIPVPHVYGMCEDPPGIVMERSPGRANLATAEDEEERRAVLDDYVEILARTHQLDTAGFEALGMLKPEGAEALGRCDLARWERGYRSAKSRAEPVIEFVLGWLERNIPKDREKATFLSADSAQFLFDKGRVTALLDLELACLGDPAADLAGMRGRDLSEPLGDLRPAFEKYFALTGERIPARVIDFHTVRFNLNTALAVAALVANPAPGIDLVQYLAWYWVWSRSCLEVIASCEGYPLDPPAPHDPAESRYAKSHAALAGRLRKQAAGDDHAAYEIDAAYRLAEYLREADRLGPTFDLEERMEVGELIQRFPEDWAASDEALEAYILSAPPDADERLVGLLHRKTLRQEALLRPVLRELADVSIQLLPRDAQP
jgi:aminoglycoside phosphotransferase (APT) family kinase protein